jgi:hypothetical protein
LFVCLLGVGDTDGLATFSAPYAFAGVSVRGANLLLAMAAPKLNHALLRLFGSIPSLEPDSGSADRPPETALPNWQTPTRRLDLLCEFLPLLKNMRGAASAQRLRFGKTPQNERRKSAFSFLSPAMAINADYHYTFLDFPVKRKMKIF